MVLDESYVRARLSYAALIPALKSALIDFSAGRIQQPVRSILGIPGRQAFFSVMPAVVDDVLGAKLVNIFPQNSILGLDTHLALIALFSSRTGELLAVMDGRLITEMRTAAVSAIATELLAPKSAHILAILGSGVQARSHWQALRMVRAFDELRVWSRNAAHARTFAGEAGGRAMLTAEEAVRGADVIVTVTNSPDPILFGKWLKSDAHVNAVGAVGPARRELDAAAMQAFVVVESRKSAAKEAGDILLAGAAIDAELGELLAGKQRESSGRTVYKSLGIAVEDLVAARLVCTNADDLSSGQTNACPMRPESNSA